MYTHSKQGDVCWSFRHFPRFSFTRGPGVSTQGRARDGEKHVETKDETSSPPRGKRARGLAQNPQFPTGSQEFVPLLSVHVLLPLTKTHGPGHDSRNGRSKTSYECPHSVWINGCSMGRQEGTIVVGRGPLSSTKQSVQCH